jgi:tetratricopeptide (TPR) repeat protein
MDDLVHNEDLLIRYIDGELQGEEKTFLEQRLKNDISLQQQLLNLQIAIQAVKQFATVQKVESIHTQMMQELKPQAPNINVFPLKKLVRFTMAAAASILLLFIGVRLYTASQITPQKLYNESFVDLNVSATRGAGNTTSVIEGLYQQKAYTSIIKTRTAAISSKDSLLIGLSYLQTEQPVKAIESFNQLRGGANEFQQDAEFYAALSYLKNREYDKALELMQKIINTPSHIYHNQFSEDIIKKVAKLKNN